MNPVANHLVQLQELMFIREEQRVAGTAARLVDLNKSINAMLKKLPPLIKRDFEALHNKHPNAIVPISNGFCTGCGMQLPRSLIQLVRLNRDIEICSQCARMLFAPEGTTVTSVGKPARKVGPRPVGIARFSSPRLMAPRLQTTDKESTIQALALAMEEGGYVNNSERLKEMAMRRESILSTAVAKGLAFPHVRGVEGGGLTLALGTSEEGIRFDEEGKELTHLVFFMAIPTAASAFYLKLLAGLAETFMDKAGHDALLAETRPDKLWKALVRHTRSTIK